MRNGDTITRRCHVAAGISRVDKLYYGAGSIVTYVYFCQGRHEIQSRPIVQSRYYSGQA